MACKMNISSQTLIFSMLMKAYYIMIILIQNDYVIKGVHGDPQVPCFFIFGDSLVDNGNNNLLPTSAKVNYRPYGIDFPGDTPTGRFSNGRTIVDILGQHLGLDGFIPPFNVAGGNAILKGVNYASGAAGIREESGQQLGARISLERQINNHQTTVLRLTNILKNRDSAQKYLNKCLYYVGMGSNDYLNNYFMPLFYPTSRTYTPQQFATLLVNQYQNQIMRLYNYGARKVALFGLGTIGCTPYAISVFGTNGAACVEKVNNAVQLFNQKLVALVDQLNAKFTNAKFIYINSFGIGSGDARSVGFKVLNAPCCPRNNIGHCVPLGTPCPNRNLYVYWDAFHPTEAANVFTAARSYTALLPSDTHPFDISHLVKLQL